jgi:hypothetical protein
MWSREHNKANFKSSRSQLSERLSDTKYDAKRNTLRAVKAALPMLRRRRAAICPLANLRLSLTVAPVASGDATAQ